MNPRISQPLLHGFPFSMPQAWRTEVVPSHRNPIWSTPWPPTSNFDGHGINPLAWPCGSGFIETLRHPDPARKIHAVTPTHTMVLMVQSIEVMVNLTSCRGNELHNLVEIDGVGCPIE